jgi:hypothetical protein
VKPRRLTREEQETIIGRCADEREWDFYTCDPVWKRRLEKFCRAQGIPITIVDRDGIRARVPIGCVKLSRPRRQTDAQRASAATALQTARACKAAGGPAPAHRAGTGQDDKPTLERSPAC